MEIKKNVSVRKEDRVCECVREREIDLVCVRERERNEWEKSLTIIEEECAWCKIESERERF